MRGKFLLAVSALCFSLSAQTKVLTDQLKADFQSAVQKSKILTKDLALIVAGPNEEEFETFFELNAQKKMTPASITKVITAAAVLEEFPPGTRFKTSIYARGKQTKEQLKGSIVFKGSGDPSFVSETMWYLVNGFMRSGIKKVTGDIIVDDSIFDEVRFDSSREKARVDRAYDAPTSGASFNWNSVNVFVRPTKAGEKAFVFLDPENQFTELINDVKTAQSSATTSVQAERVDHSKGKNVLRVQGRIAEGASEVVIYKNITQPDLWTGHQLKSFLQQRGVSIDGNVVRGKLEEDSDQWMASADSKPIEQIVADMNKFSNNYVAEMLTKHLGTKKSLPGKVDTGVQKLHEFLQKIGIKKNDYQLISPSGLNRDNQFSAEQILNVLIHTQKQLKLFPEFLTSLPIAGIDGTLKNRMKSSAAERWVRAKTGYLDSVVSLAGYAGRKDGTVIPFVFIFNGSADESRVRALFDRLCILLVDEIEKK
jgi:D-alanyl-D-alanine carboxypeptidase/D-alanyl-D-alanine-endopeptidase (penicillin-binding protein 4)